MIEKEPRKKTFWALWIFYLLIAFEIIYMISPFAIYYYSVYGKGLRFLNNNPATHWLTGFFLPHFAETSSGILNIYKDIGWTLAITGFFLFCIGAGQIYYYKFTGKEVVTGGIYNFIRHPQYASLSLCSFGLLLVWPRYIVLIMFITMLFAYYFLAKTEEKECEKKFGKSYVEYKQRTQMFLPIPIPFKNKLPALPQSGMKRYIFIAVAYTAVIAASISMANMLRSYSIEKLYTSHSDNSVTISLGKIERDTLEELVGLALKDREVQKRLARTGNDSHAKFFNYVLPSEWFFPDIPMNDPKKIGEHYRPANYDRNSFKILFMKAVLRTNAGDAKGNGLILETVRRVPIVEVEVKLDRNIVVRLENPPETVIWGDIPTPLF